MSCSKGITVVEDIKPNNNTFLIGISLLSVGIIGFIYKSKTK